MEAEREEIKSPQLKQEPCQKVTIKQEKIEEDPPMETQQIEEKIPAEVKAEAENWQPCV